MDIFIDYWDMIWSGFLTYLPLCVTGLFFVIGLMGTLLPILPGNLIVWLGVLIHQLWVPESSVGWQFVILSAVLTIIAHGLDWVCSFFGAMKFGASWRGGVGAVLGALIGFFIPPPLFWLIIGPIIGAVVGELLGGRNLREAGKAGVGTILGGLLAFIIKIAIGCFIIVYFSLDVFL